MDIGPYIFVCVYIYRINSRIEEEGRRGEEEAKKKEVLYKPQYFGQ